MEWSKLLSEKRQVEREQEPENFLDYPISEFERDYKAIISSSAFRRLQDKTQVFPLDKSDFVRTRLTHSIEVSTIARQLGIMLTQNESRFLKDDFKNNPKLAHDIPVVLSCAGLLHDIGNPPFGHFGEVVIGDWFKNEFTKESFVYKGRKISDVLSDQMKADLENFEGNAQALRILAKIANNEKSYDINLSYAVLNTLVKYPTDSLSIAKTSGDVKKHKMGFYLSEKDLMEAVCKETGTRIAEDYQRHPLVFLVEAADDIAYATADLEDGLKKGMFTLDQFVEFYESQNKCIVNKSQLKYSIDLLDDLKARKSTMPRNKENDLIAFQKWMDFARKWFMYVVIYRFSMKYDEIMCGQYKQSVFDGTFLQETIKIFKKSAFKLVFNHNEILKLELAAKKILESLLNDFVHAVIYFGENSSEYKMSKADEKLVSLISENFKEDYLRAKTGEENKDLYLRFLMVTDFISGMTDSYAKNLYNELNGMN